MYTCVTVLELTVLRTNSLATGNTNYARRMLCQSIVYSMKH